MPNSVTNLQLMEAVGDLREAFGGMKRDIEHGTRSRKVLHTKMEAQGEALNETVKALIKINAALDVNTEAVTQARDMAHGAMENFHRFETEFKTVTLPAIQNATNFQNDASPIIRQMKIVRNIIMVLFGTGVLSFAGLLAAFVWAREHLGIILRMILGVT